MPVVVYGTTPWSQASLTVTPDISMEPGTCSTSSGVVFPSSIAAAAVMIFATEPGSKTSCTTRLPKTLPSSSCSSMLPRGLMVSEVAMEMTSPVSASRTTAEADSAPDLSLPSWRSSWM